METSNFTSVAEGMQQVVNEVMSDIRARREERMGNTEQMTGAVVNETAEKPKTIADEFAALQSAQNGQKERAEQKEVGANGQTFQKMEQITLKFGKGCVGEPFQGKDGNSYCEILIPNADQNDKRPWQTFVVKANHVHENQFGKGMWCKVPANGTTTLRRNSLVGKDENGKGIWETQKEKVTNRDLKKMVESYKERSSMKEMLAEKKEEAQKITITKSEPKRAQEAAL